MTAMAIIEKCRERLKEIPEVCTGKHDLAIVTAYLAGKSAADIGRECGLSCARVLDILDNVKRRCLWYDKRKRY